MWGPGGTLVRLHELMLCSKMKGAAVGVAGGGTEGRSPFSFTRYTKARTTSLTPTPSSLSSHNTMHLASAPITVVVACPFSSSLVVRGLTGTVFQCQLVDGLGSHVVRV